MGDLNELPSNDNFHMLNNSSITADNEDSAGFEREEKGIAFPKQEEESDLSDSSSKDFTFVPPTLENTSTGGLRFNENSIKTVTSDEIFSKNGLNATELNIPPVKLENLNDMKMEQIIDNDTVTQSKASQENLVSKYEEIIRKMEEEYKYLTAVTSELESKYENMKKQKDFAIKEKESMVIKYAVSERHILEQKQAKEQIEKKYKEVVRENDILQHKVQTMVSEKARICQMLDNKCYEHKTTQQELEHTKSELNSLETKLKWSQNSLKNEIELHKESKASIDALKQKLQNVADQIEQAKMDAQTSIKTFQTSQENRAYVLDNQLKEQQATLILLKHEKEDREQHVKNLQAELERLQNKQKDMLQENNDLSLRVQQLERDRVETEQKLRELRGCADQQRQDAADLQAKAALIEQMKLQLSNEQEQLKACHDQIDILKQRNTDLESDMEACRLRETELLLFTQQLTDKNVRLQSEFTSMETKVQQLNCENAMLKRSIKEQETKISMLTSQLSEESLKYSEENGSLTKELSEKSKLCEKLKQEVTDQVGENSVVKRKMELSLREVTKELQHCRKRLEHYESMGTHSSSSSSSSLNVTDKSNESPSAEQVQVIQPVTEIDRQTLIEHIAKLQRISAKKSEKLDFLEEHVHSLVMELQKKSRLLQSYVLREQAGTLTSNKMDNNKAHLAKLNGIMASMYSSKVMDNNLTLELSLDINRKLQAVLEDTLLKNITLKENVDTLGAEIDRLNKLFKT